MTIPAGKRLGPYEILSAIGAGGMGEVYKARDTRLDRIVAIKVLPPHFADRPELRDRFEREARTIANLKHPHICVLYDIGHDNGTHYLVMEYLEGETVAERLKRGPLPLEQVLQYAIEIADALDTAHRQHFTHRDIKPANIMLTKTAGTKLLDFGLAKLKQEVNPAIPPDERPTNLGLTAEGTILGTFQYMAPEQVEGRTNDIDGRTDVFAFGALVYEMATGKKAFEGKSQASVIAAILEREVPPMSALQPMTPASLDRVVKRCLAKDRDQRWQTATDLCNELQWIKEADLLTKMATGSPIARSHLLRRWALVSGVICLVVAIIASIAAWNLKPSPPAGSPQVTRLDVTLPFSQRLEPLNTPILALSPDGTKLAYVSSEGGVRRIYVRSMDSSESKPIPGTEGGESLFFSPDGKWLGFLAGSKLMKISTEGGVPLPISDAPNPRGTSWGENDTILLAPAYGGYGLAQVSAGGGKPESVTSRESMKQAEAHRWPQLLPGGEAVLFTAWRRNMEESQIVVQSLKTGQRKVLVQGGWDGRYVPSGHLVFDRQGNLFAIPFDPTRLETTGAPVPILEGVLEATEGVAQFSFSSQGSLAYVSGGAVRGSERSLVWIDRSGKEQPTGAPLHPYASVNLSPDGQRVAVTIQGANDDVWTYDIPRQRLTRLTFEGRNTNPIWTSDGTRITFRSDREGASMLNLFWMPADGSGAPERLAPSEYGQAPGAWSSDGQFLVFLTSHPTNGWDLWILPMTGDHKPYPFLQTPFSEMGARFSPDGRWLAYQSNESGRFEIYVRPFPGPGGKWLVSTAGGTSLRWARNGRELFYLNGEKMMVAEIQTQPTFGAGNPRLLFEGGFMTGITGVYDVAPDGQRFLMVKPVESQTSAPTQIHVVLNWFEELKRKVPTKQ